MLTLIKKKIVNFNSSQNAFKWKIYFFLQIFSQAQTRSRPWANLCWRKQDELATFGDAKWTLEGHPQESQRLSMQKDQIHVFVARHCWSCDSWEICVVLSRSLPKVAKKRMENKQVVFFCHQIRSYSNSFIFFLFSGWKLDATEGPTRIRRRITRCRLNIDNKFFHPYYLERHSKFVSGKNLWR